MLEFQTLLSRRYVFRVNEQCFSNILYMGPVVLIFLCFQNK